MFSPVIFEGSEATNMTAHFGSTAMLACRIRNNVEDNPVSVFLHFSVFVYFSAFVYYSVVLNFLYLCTYNGKLVFNLRVGLEIMSLIIW